MSRLKVMLRGALISEIELINEKEYVGGRKDGCDIRLQAEKGISREHFRLKHSDGRWTLQALSRFGDVFSLGQKVEQIGLDHGQSFQIPPYEFQIYDIPESDFIVNSAPPPVPISEHDRTVVGVSPQVPYVKIVGAKGEVREMLRLEIGEIWVAGRDPSCQVVIPDQRVSRRQFEIHKVNGNYTIIDLGSVNGTFLNGSPVSSSDPQTLKSGDAITVLDNAMYFELHDPNFKYKVDRIEVPPLAFEPNERVDSSAMRGGIPGAGANSGIGVDENQTQNLQSPNFNQNQQNIPLIPEIPASGAQEFAQPQFNPAGGPFTGMPPQGDPNQFYTFNPTAEQPGPETSKFKSPVLFLIVLLLAGGIGFYLIDGSQPSQPLPTQEPVAKNDSADAVADPFSRLTKEQQSQIKENYTLADQMITQNKYDLALEKLQKIHDVLETGYLDSLELKRRAEDALQSLEMTRQDEELARAKEENTKKIAQFAAECEKLLKTDVTANQMRECLAPISQIDVTAPEYIRLMAAAEKIEKDKQARELEERNRKQQEQELVDLFNKAEAVQMEGLPYRSIEQYKNVINASLPDPKKLKKKAKERIEFIKAKIADKTQKSLTTADILAQEGRFKMAVLSLREVLQYDPDNPKIAEKVQTYREELRRQSRLLYQESIIDESYGIIDSSETRQGAKEKWKRITEIDLDDGEYFKKAVIKLRRYGML